MIRWTSAARAEVLDIFDHIAQDDFPTAEDVAHRIVAAVQRLEQFPNIGRPGSRPGTRELVLPRLPFVVVYRSGDVGVEILRLLHTAQRWPTPASPGQR